ncbi:RdgB/HAM1 family non-canonical purine NTP pyrophosphatase [SAR202 cluster bacterium AC-409-J13_OGT_754m]|nr:RdgB/HAM1 family non-canonical purine NTP pyrophosphatase [SAR202 cluster bacterium AC-409-J13_OGT_754m]
MKKLLVATKNQGKLNEFVTLLAELPYKLVSLNTLGITEVVEETGSTFYENALIKAKTYSRLSKMDSLADDSGLEVDALDGRPGVWSSRYGSESMSDEDRVQLLLSELQGVPWDKRTARFKCVIVLATTLGCITTVESSIEGFIQCKAQGSNGFGYDPIFYLPESDCTSAELATRDKNDISHRGKAAKQLIKVFK